MEKEKKLFKTDELLAGLESTKMDVYKLLVDLKIKKVERFSIRKPGYEKPELGPKVASITVPPVYFPYRQKGVRFGWGSGFLSGKKGSVEMLCSDWRAHVNIEGVCIDTEITLKDFETLLTPGNEVLAESMRKSAQAAIAMRRGLSHEEELSLANAEQETLSKRIIVLETDNLNYILEDRIGAAMARSRELGVKMASEINFEASASYLYLQLAFMRREHPEMKADYLISKQNPAFNLRIQTDRAYFPFEKTTFINGMPTLNPEYPPDMYVHADLKDVKLLTVVPLSQNDYLLRVPEKVRRDILPSFSEETNRMLEIFKLYAKDRNLKEALIESKSPLLDANAFIETIAKSLGESPDKYTQLSTILRA